MLSWNFDFFLIFSAIHACRGRQALGNIIRWGVLCFWLSMD